MFTEPLQNPQLGVAVAVTLVLALGAWMKHRGIIRDLTHQVRRFPSAHFAALSMHIVVPCRKRFLRTALIVGLALGGLIALTGKVFIDITTQKAAPLVAKMLREAIVEVKRNGAPAKRDLANLVLKRDYSDLFLWSIGLASYELQGIEGSARPKKVLAPANIGMAEVEAALHSGAFFPAPKFSKDHHLHPAILKQAEWFDERDYKERMVTLFIYVAAPALFLLIFVTALLLTLPRYRAARAELRRLSGGRPAQARG